MRLIIPDNAVVSTEGHNFSFDLCLIDEAARRGFETILFVCRECPPDLIAELGAIPAFRNSTYVKPQAAPIGVNLQEIYTAQYAADLASFNSAIRPDDLVVVHSPFLKEIEGVRKWFASFSPEIRPHLALQIMEPVEYLCPPDILAQALVMLCATVPNIRLYAHTAELAAECAELTGLKVRPIGTILRVPVKIETPISPRRLRFSFLGGAYPQKGFGLLAPAIEATLAMRADLDFRIQISGASDPHQADIVRLRRLGEAVSLIEAPLSEQDYLMELAATDGLLLPYEPRRYPVTKGSNIFAEAIAFELPCVVSPATWPHRRLIDMDFPGVVMRDWSAEALTQAICHLAEEYPERKRRAVAAAPGWRAVNGTAAFFDTLLEGYGEPI